MLVEWMAPYVFQHGDYQTMITEYTRAVKVLSEFADSGQFYDSLSYCCEALAFAYANYEDYEMCLAYLEKACEYAEKQDQQGIVEIIEDMMMEDEKVSLKNSMLQAINSNERQVYDPIRTTERFQAIDRRLSE
ncbi:MAG TPA: hypothetical protein GX701_09175 [Clostridiales bacterium]|jgi:tetratricopeptide (TPR) repeat protein|nr:hypothetical protein [Clostridiales bacterium]